MLNCSLPTGKKKKRLQGVGYEYQSFPNIKIINQHDRGLRDV